MKTLAMDADDALSQDENLVTLKVYIPDLLIQKNFQFQKDEFIWDIKEQIIDSLPKELKESFNYGIFCPPINGKAGKFLDEQRPLADYPFHSSVGYVELRYKRRVYKMMNVEEKQIKQLHTRANLRRMIDHVNSGQVEKITKMCARGMDPNFHCPETGESPLTLATGLKQPAKVIMALINGGALLDFRTKDGLTALHKAVEKNNLEALKTLLDLGASPNYKDSKGLTPLYYTLLHASDHQLTEILLHDHAFIGTCDPQGWQEVHQACKHGLVQHLEHLLFYGADMNARNASGNTPLHVCAVNDQESCARVLLFRGADKNALNFANQNPYQVAVIAGNLTLGELIRNHNPEDVVPYREMPRYNPRRRASIAPVPTLSRTHSDPRLDLNLGMKPPSPCPSNCSLPPFSSISCISDASTGSSSTCTQPSGEDSEDTASGSVVTEKSVTSDSSGVCTSNSAASYESGPEHHVFYDSFLPGSKCVCVSSYSSGAPGHLQLSYGDTVEIINEAEDGLLLGKLPSGQVGYFPVSCVQEVNSRVDNLQSVGYPRVEGRRERCAKRVSTIPRRWKAFGEPRTVILHRGKKGFGFVLRGAKASSPLMEKEANVSWPSQYLEDVNKGGVADLAGLKKGDYLLEINGQDVSQASHEHVVSIIQQSGNLVAMTVVTLKSPPVASSVENVPLPYRQCATLPRKLAGKKAPTPPKRDPKTTLSVGRVRARSMVAGLAEIESLDRTLNEYDSEGRSTKSSSVESIPNKAAMKAANSHLTKTASIKARPSSQRVSAAELEQFFARQGSKRHLRSHTLNTRSRADSRPPKVYGSVAEMKRSRASRSKLTEATLKVHKDFSSTPDLKAVNLTTFSNSSIARKKSLSQEDLQNVRGNRHSWACTPNGYNSYLGLCDNEECSLNYNDAWKSIEDVYDSTIPVEQRDVNSDIYAQTLPITKKDKSFRASCPPPSHPPPPPPIGQVIKVDVSKALGEYANVNMTDEDGNSQIMSSFRPGDSAKLYASPEVVMSVGYKSEPVSVAKDAVHPRRSGGGSSLRSQSLPPKIPVNKSDKGSTTSSEAENSGDSGGLYSTFKKTNRQRDSMSTDSGHVSDRGALWSIKGKSAVTSAYSSKFDFEDSDAGSPQNYPTVKTPNHEPFIPEPDYESSEDDFMPISVDKGGSLSTFGKGDSGVHEEKVPNQSDFPDNQQMQIDNSAQFSPHTEAKRAIQEARDRLRFSQKPLDKNATVVFISGKITEHKVEKSEIQLHRTEEGRLTGTVVISTTNEPQESHYLSSSILKTYENEKCTALRYPSRDAPASEYAKYRQQILSGMNQPVDSESNLPPPPVIEVVESDSVIKQSDGAQVECKKDFKPIDGLKITLTGSQKSPDNKGDIEKEQGECPYLPVKGLPNDIAENSSSGVSSDIDTQSDQIGVMSSSTEDDSKAETVVQLSESGHLRESQNINQSKSDKPAEHIPATKTEKPPDIPSQYETASKKTAKEIAMSLASELQGLRHSNIESKPKSQLDIIFREPSGSVIKSAQTKDRKHSGVSPRREKKHESEAIKAKTATESSLEESLEVLRLQVNSLGLAAVNEVDVFTELVPPPPEFAAAAAIASENTSKKETYSSSEIAIAPPPEFSDNSPQLRNKTSSHRTASNVHQRKNYPLSCHLNASPNSVDLNFLTSLRSKSPNILHMVRKDKKSCLGSGSGSVNVHLPCTSGLRHLPSFNPSEHSLIHESATNDLSRLKSVQKEFRFKLLQEWTSNDIADWLDSLFLPEYKQRFSEAGITGAKLANMDSNDLMGLGVKQMGHRLNMERSLKRYLK
ncbi:SH3 and multiple ankyrin repeat domains protein 2-like isoform X2 [Argiope bruennichi]|nr:SH3 and multiple ankyrin repeat domains protein 2-like isoform X2 [Argiope bruennichi]XP_055926711.1 SH3 and multiple ankyrin repeat domains protein 2-like isoform X2 [Argiope bruennichi]XP_055926712.1 SH3 and multiple ankyrin repeat domains protein 2-like isoform X2 [Argiope bruennichi]